MTTERTFERQLISIRRQIHQYPELGNSEFRTTAFVEKVLKGAGIVTKRPSKTGLVALIAGDSPSRVSPGKCFGMRADLDALPIQEKTGAPYASKRPGIMHACGHDANTTMLLGAALLLRERRKEFSGAVKLIFQPNEESSGGAQTLVEKGVLRSPDVDAIVGVHINPWLPAGVMGLKPGEMMAAVDRFTLEIIGEGGHGAYPHLGRDTIVIASHVISALQTLVARELDPVEPVVITVGTIAGGEAFNILANRVTMTGTVRTLSDKLHKSIARHMERRIAAIVRSYGAGYRFAYEVLGYPLSNSAEILEVCRASGERVLGADKVRTLGKPSMGGEDFSEYLRYVPGCFIFLGAGRKVVYPWHNERFDIDERALLPGARVLADIAKSYLNG